jgi:hypothetical protein
MAGPRRPTRGAWVRGAGYRLGGGVLVLAALAVGGAITKATPDTDSREHPFVHTGAVGERISVRGFDATIKDVTGAAKISQLGRDHDTGGVWVVVRVRVVARDEPVIIGYAAVRDEAGHTYRASTRIDQPLVGRRTLQPDVPVEGQLVFEVPRSAVAHLSVRLSQPAVDQRLEAVAEIALPTTRSTVDEWSTQARTLRLETARAVA